MKELIGPLVAGALLVGGLAHAAAQTPAGAPSGDTKVEKSADPDETTAAGNRGGAGEVGVARHPRGPGKIPRESRRMDVCARHEHEDQEGGQGCHRDRSEGRRRSSGSLHGTRRKARRPDSQGAYTPQARGQTSTSQQKRSPSSASSSALRNGRPELPYSATVNDRTGGSGGPPSGRGLAVFSSTPSNHTLRSVSSTDPTNTRTRP